MPWGGEGAHAAWRLRHSTGRRASGTLRRIIRKGLIVRRRSLAGALALLLLPGGAALAQTAAPPAAGAAAPRRPALPALRWEEMTPQQRRRVQQRLAAQGRPDLSAEEAQRMWDGMSLRQRRAAMRQGDGNAPARGRAGAGGTPPQAGTQPAPAPDAGTAAPSR